MSLPFLSDSSLASRIFVDLLEGLMRPLGKLTLVLVADWSLPLHVSVSGGFLGGPNAAIGQVDIGWWPICHSHSMCWYLGDFLEGLICPIVTPTPPLEAECAMVFFVPSLPATSFSHPSPRPISPCLDPINSSTHLKTAWFASSYFCPLPCLLTLSPDLSARAWIPSSPPLTSRRLGLLHPISARYLVCSPFPQTCQPVLGSHQVLCSPQDGLVCIFSSAPTTSFTHPSCTGFFYMAGWLAG